MLRKAGEDLTKLYEREQALLTRLEGIEQSIVDTDPTSLSGVMVQVMLDTCRASLDDNEAAFHRFEGRKAHNLLVRALKALERMTDVNREEFAGDKYMPRRLDGGAAFDD